MKNHWKLSQKHSFSFVKSFKEMTFASKSGFFCPPSLSPGRFLKLLIVLVSETLRGKAQLDLCILHTDAKCEYSLLLGSVYFNLQYLWMKDWNRAQCRENYGHLWLWPPCVLLVISGYQVSEQQVIILMHCPSDCICLVHAILFKPCWLFEGGVLLLWGCL